MKIFKKAIVTFIILLLLAVAALYIYLNLISPQYSGEMKINGLTSEVTVYTDEYGIPHIYAGNEEDAYIALGYLHAQERLFQMEFLRRLGGGRLAAIFGEELIMTDRFFRTIGLDHMAEKAVTENHTDSNSPYHRAATAYLKGLNEFIARGATPVEFTLLGIPKEKFTLKDCYIISGYMSYSFSGGFTTDPLLDFINQNLGEAYMKDLDIKWPKGELASPPTEKNALKAGIPLELNRQLASTLGKYPVPQFEGSNGWVLSPSKSRSGSVLFENDAHMGYSQPSTWYEAHLEYPGQSFYGNFLAGFPFALIGHNKDIAWGFTMLLNDDLDFYQERLNPDNPDQVWVDDHWERLLIREEKISVKDEPDIAFQVKESRHGPMLGHVLGKDKSIKKLDSADLSVWWTYHKFTSRHLELTYKMSRAGDMDSFRSIVSGIHAPGLNVMYGDRQGNIAWWAAAKLVKRAGHVNSKLILDGAGGKDEHLGFYQFSENPGSENPPSGFVYSANSQPEPIQGELYAGYYAPDDRAQRIEQLLSGKEDWSLDELKEMVMDDVSRSSRSLGRELAEIITDSGKPLSPDQQRSLEQLKTWNGSHQKNGTAPALYYPWITKILRLMMEDEMGAENYNLLTTTMLLKRSYPALFRNEGSVWWDNITTKEIRETRTSVIYKAFQQTFEEIRRNSGNEPNSWTWGNAHQLEHGHVVGRQKPLDRLFNVGPFSVSGGQEVINNKDFFLKDTAIIDIRNGSAMRILIDFADIENSYNINPTGQSGYFMSRHYSDQAEMYNTGKFRKQMMNKEEISGKSRKLLLKPEID